MRKIFICFLTIFIIQLQVANSFAGSDGKIKLSKNNQKSETLKEVKDCFEPVNRATFAFNQGIDKIFFKPVAKVYRKFPQPIRSGTSNVLSNLSTVVTVPNNLLQGQLKDAGINTLRFGINTTLGIGGIFDVASYYGLKKKEKEDYGQTLGSWGFGEGCYFVLPVLGPTTVRDSIGSIANFTGGDAWYNVTILNNSSNFSEADYYTNSWSRF